MSSILLIDDNDDLREIFSIFLEMKGHFVHAVPGGMEALELLNTVKPDIILLDIMMPGMDGWETLCAIKKNPATKHLPVSMCSGKLPDIDEINRYGNHIEDYLVKPQELSELSAILVSITKRYIDRRSESESLKNRIQEPKIVDEFYNSQKKLYILEKFSRFFTGDKEKIESAIQMHKSRMLEIRDALNHPVLYGGLELQPEKLCVQHHAVSPHEHGFIEPGVRTVEFIQAPQSSGRTFL